MRISPGDLVVGINPYNHNKRKFKYLGKNKGIGSRSHQIRLYDYKQKCEIMVTKQCAKQWKVEKYGKEQITCYRFVNRSRYDNVKFNTATLYHQGKEVEAEIS